MSMEFWVHCTAKIEGSYETNCDSFKSCVLHYVTPYLLRDGLRLPFVKCDDTLEPFEFEGEVLMKGDINFGFKVDGFDAAEMVANVCSLWSIHFGASLFNVEISGRFSR